MKKIVFLGIFATVLLSYSIAFAGCCDPKPETGKMNCDTTMTDKKNADGMKVSMMDGMDNMGGMDHSMVKGDKAKTEKAKKLQTVEQDGYKFTFDFIAMKMGKATHHLMVSIEDASGKKITNAMVNYKTIAPGGKEGVAMAMKMGAGFGGNVNLSEKGKHQIEATVKIGDKKVLVKTHYETK